jgi:hypothetical protein
LTFDSVGLLVGMVISSRVHLHNGLAAIWLLAALLQSAQLALLRTNGRAYAELRLPMTYAQRFRALAFAWLQVRSLPWRQPAYVSAQPQQM